jgi:hypothetical protein
MFAINWAGRGHHKNLITQGAAARLKPLLEQGLPKSRNFEKQKRKAPPWARCQFLYES